MATIKTEQKKFNGSNWDTIYQKTSADLIVETTTKKILTSDERSKISDNLSSFNGSNQLVKTDGTGKIPSSIVDIDSKLDKDNPTFTGTLTGPKIEVPNVVFLDGTLVLSGDGGIKLSKSDNGPGIDADNQVIFNLQTPTGANDAVTKNYVDSLVQLNLRAVEYVEASSTSNINLSNAVSSMDGHSLASGNRVLLKNQTTVSQNGIYTVGTDLKLTKVVEDSTQGAYVFVANGDTYNDW